MNKWAVVSLISFVLANCFHVDALKCYDCSSQDNAGCGDPFTAEDTLIDCQKAPKHIEHMINTTEARFCRKLKQTINGEHQIVTRSCGYLTNNDTASNAKPCFKDAFSSFSNSIYCSCSDNECNGANSNGILNLSLIFTVSIAAILKCFCRLFT